MSNEVVLSTNWHGRELTIKTGKLAKQANSAVTVQYGDTVVLATVVESKFEREGIDFFPLMVDLEERYYAAGIIKGSRWIKREGRPSDEAILTGRMIDRSIRPFFAGDSRKDVQVVITLLSADLQNDHDIVGLVAASAALSISGVDWKGPIGGIRVGRVENKFVLNPTYEERDQSDLDLIVAGTEKKVIMIEAAGDEIPEDTMYDAIMEGQKALEPALKLIGDLKNKVKAAEIKSPKTHEPNEEEKAEQAEKEKVLELASKWLKENINPILFDKTYYTKGERKAAVTAIKEGLDDYLFSKDINKDLRKYAIKKQVETMVEAEVTNAIIDKKQRVDGRKLDEIRELYSEAGLLTRIHGSGLFSRGETQVMSIVTLGGPGLAQMLEGVEGTGEKRFMHHYNFPPYSVAEAKPMRGAGRRDIGHGALAEKALEPVLPEKDDFPYTIRVVSEVLGSNGSSSMGSTCGSTLALMDAGVPITKPVAGIAMGLASNDDMSKWEVLTDIQDLEDGKGGMDFKITGTDDGITAIQLDTKTLGINKNIVKQTLTQGKKARLDILKVMNKAIAEPRENLSQYAPRITSFHIDPEKIRDVIGAGGKIINEIISATEVTIDIEDDGLVVVCGNDAENSKKAVDWINDIVRDITAGEIFTGTVVKLMDFGVFVEVLPGRDGMVHVSQLAPYRIEKPGDFLNVGDSVTVKVNEIDDQGRTNLTMLGLKENEHLWESKKVKSEGFGGGGGRSGFRNNNNGRKFPPRGPRKG